MFSLVAVAALPAAFAGFGWVFDGTHGFRGGDPWASFQLFCFEPLENIFSILAPPNPHLMGDRRLVWAFWKILYDTFGANYLVYNIVNMIAHVGVVIAFYFVARGLTFNRLTSVSAAFIFMFSAIGALSVSFQPAMQDIFCAGFLFVAFALYLRGDWLGIALALPFYWLSLRCKEYAVLLPVALTVHALINATGVRGLYASALRIAPFALLLIGYMLVTLRGIRYAIENFAVILPSDSLYRTSPDLTRLFAHLNEYIGQIIGAQFAGAGFVFIALLGAALLLRDRRVLFCLCSFLIFCVPFVTLAHTTDYYAYVPAPFLFLAIAGGVVSAVERYSLSRTAAFAVLVLYGVAQTTALPYSRSAKASAQAWIREDRPFLAFMAKEHPTLPKGVRVFVDGIDAPPTAGPSAFFIGKRGAALSLNAIYRDHSLMAFGGATHEEIAASYSMAEAPKLYVRLQAGGWRTIEDEGLAR